jgi:hypothetical protein
MGKLADSIRVMSYDHEDLERLSTFLRKIDGIFPIPLSVQSSLKSRNINIFLDAYFCHEKVRRDSYP